MTDTGGPGEEGTIHTGGLERELLQAQRRANAAVFRGGKAACLTGATSLMEGVEAGG